MTDPVSRASGRSIEERRVTAKPEDGRLLANGAAVRKNTPISHLQSDVVVEAERLAEVDPGEVRRALRLFNAHSGSWVGQWLPPYYDSYLSGASYTYSLILRPKLSAT
jgi:hypothetical protein